MKIKIFSIILLFSGSIFFIIACRSEQQNNSSEKTTGISFNVSVNNFGEASASPQTTSKAISGSTNLTNRHEFTSGPFSITSELSAASPDIGENAAVSPRSFTNNNVRIRIVAYIAETGEYADQVLTTVTNSKQKLFNLVGNRRYTFVTYSFNSDTTDPPAAPMVNISQAKINITGLNGQSGKTDLLYTVNENVLLSGGTTSINIILKRKFSRIIINVDDSDATGTPGQTNYVRGSYAMDNNNTGGFTGSISDFYTSGNLNLKDGTITEGVNQALAISRITTSPQTLIINTGGKAAYKSKLIIPAKAIAIGRDTNRAPVSIAIDGLGNGLQPGRSYTLKLKFNSDRYVNADGITQPRQSARYAVIGGYRWDRFNVGVTDNSPALNNPDEPGIEIHGAKYMFGAYTGELNNYISQDQDKTNSPIGAWKESPPLTRKWNKGTDMKPIKNTETDPCDQGYRIATTNEYHILIDNTASVITGSYGQLSYGQQLYSKKSHDVLLTFPAAGFRGSATGSSPGQIIGRGKIIYYWTSSGTFEGLLTGSTGSNNGLSIRCIQD